MKTNIEHNADELFSMLRVPWPQQKEELWKNVASKMTKQKVIPFQTKGFSWQIAAAAVVVVTMGLGIFMRSYTTSVTTFTAQHTSTQLPDGSSVQLNAQSEMSYQPYWWWANRQVKLAGEAFFEVKKGKAFQVISPSGVTEVLGTKFNVFSRGERYEVACLSGKVMVKAKLTQHSVILHPNEKASLQETGQLKVVELKNGENTTAWISNKMVFTTVSIKEVFKEIERQYAVKINVPNELNFRYSGSLDKSESIDDVLAFICRPFELKVKKTGKNKYAIETK